ncbi:peptidoglycan hydrolase-like protein with peptidoglycan-binding domain [Nocardioides albertanoniae]|uniref:Peptidoglycan hydrolase-like protein with peptidoglycan-binding domain n=2 Tax=Nocardioides albertanoniae TaxID=1175486 RepID=A0A543A167_9ACTN|nr:peptidoglycan hydrolase-like protein with peptidoglycan-binding domain [Nocardioides albertanoniae]
MLLTAILALGLSLGSMLAPSSAQATTTSTSVGKTGLHTAYKALYKQGSSGIGVRRVQARLKERRIYGGRVTGNYGSKTAGAVKIFQRNQHLAVTGKVNQRTLDRLRSMTHTPTDAKLYNLHRNCVTSGRVLCVDKTDRRMRYVRKGHIVRSIDARFGCSNNKSRQGTFKVYRKSRNHVSSIYHTPMPYAMFFSGGQAVHYSSDFAARGYNGCSHGCVNVRNKSSIRWVFDQIRINDRVVVYRS